MSMARKPSAITLPDRPRPYPALVEFLADTFPHLSSTTWAARLRDGKLLDEDHRPLPADSPYIPGRRIFYFREVEAEPRIPFAEEILFSNGEILVADKPHFLPVVPGGRYVNECLEQRLRDRTGIAELVVLHRIDRETAGLVLCSLNPRTRRRYHDLFAQGLIEKTYTAWADLTATPATDHWHVANRLVRGEPRFRMQATGGEVNARSVIHLEEITGQRGRFRLHPLTGKTHQLRVHLSGLGFPIVNDRLYPALRPETPDDLEHPLQLLARGLRFRDPVRGAVMEFQSARTLAGPASSR